MLSRLLYIMLTLTCNIDRTCAPYLPIQKVPNSSKRVRTRTTVGSIYIRGAFDAGVGGEHASLPVSLFVKEEHTNPYPRPHFSRWCDAILFQGNYHRACCIMLKHAIPMTLGVLQEDLHYRRRYKQIGSLCRNHI